VLQFFSDQTAGLVGFHVAKAVVDALDDWELAQDWEVFNEKLRTGSYHGRYELPEPLRQLLLKKRDELKRPMPYYGCGGVSGSSYRFELLLAKVALHVEHSCTQEVFNRESERPPQAFTVSSTWSIGDKAYRRLRALENGRFVKPDCSDCRFCFAPTGLGLVCKVQMQLDAPWVDLTDYDEW
jgi:hypothetical protein